MGNEITEYQYFDGKDWYYGDQSIEGAIRGFINDNASFGIKNRKWRGVAAGSY
jgi:hypothetical protein